MGKLNIKAANAPYTDEEIGRITHSLSRMIFHQLLPIANELTRIAEDCLRFAPIGVGCRREREARGEDLKTVAKATKLAQYHIKNIEEGQITDIPSGAVEKYIAHLGLESWFEDWRSRNRDLATRLAVRSQGSPLASQVERILYRGLLEEREAPVAAAGRVPSDPVAASATGEALALRLKVLLVGSKPLIWRRIVVPSSVTLHRLHEILQVVMGWTDSHLYQFEVGGLRYIDPETMDEDFDPRERDARAVHLSSLELLDGSGFKYLYDFGDDWDHRIMVEAIDRSDPAPPLPLCLAGAGACPPEDSGGISGYADLLEAVADPDHDDHDQMVEWLPKDFDPKRFDASEVNRALRPMQRKSKKSKSRP